VPGSNLPGMTTELDYIAHLAGESARFLEVVSQLPADAPVPSCPDWDADDLLWHLGEVQFFWGTVVREGVSGEEAEARTPERPRDRAGLADFFTRASRELVGVLAVTPPQAPAWSWSTEQTAGFTRRRQAHEALIHRVDAELTADDRTPLDPQLSADGVDEALRIMYAGVPDWGTFTPEPGRTLRITASDTGHSWLVTLGRFTGTSPDSGKVYDEPDIEAVPLDAATAGSGGPAAAEVSGTAADLDCWLWHRPAQGVIEHSGDRNVLRGFETAIGPGIS